MKHFSLMMIVALLAAVSPAYAVDPAIVYVVHGIPGTALGLPTTDLLVDVRVGGFCVPALQGLNFGDIRGPLPIDPGTYPVELRPADALNPCSKNTILQTDVTVTAGLNASLVAHLTAAGAPAVSPFVTNIAGVSAEHGRFILHHAAQAPAVEARLFRPDTNGNMLLTAVPGFANGGQAPADVRPGPWRATLSVNNNVVFGPAMLNLDARTVQLVYAIGTFPDTFRFVTRSIPAAR